MAEMTCPWCKRAFEPRTGQSGSPKRFCSEACRIAFHRGARLWALREFEAGRAEVDHRLRRLPDGRLTTVPIGFRWGKGAAHG